jgi:hypothetical protein
MELPFTQVKQLPGNPASPRFHDNKLHMPRPNLRLKAVLLCDRARPKNPFNVRLFLGKPPRLQRESKAEGEQLKNWKEMS